MKLHDLKYYDIFEYLNKSILIIIKKGRKNNNVWDILKYFFISYKKAHNVLSRKRNKWYHNMPVLQIKIPRS